ncbi:MAG: glycosyltransferase family 4 protein [Anaerolineales bacterium]|nr:glycosyltransferase family 4 protein [Anaerolineales bacterium]
MRNKKRILIHDYGGFSFIFQLSHTLASRGYEVIHVYCDSNNKTGFIGRDSLPSTVKLVKLGVTGGLKKDRFFLRWIQENQYANKLISVIKLYKPDIVFSANSPLDVQRRLASSCKKHNAKFVYWLQDLIGIATHKVLTQKLGWLGKLIAAYYIGVEKRSLLFSDAIIAISPNFSIYLRKLGIDKKKVFFIPNWAPLNEVRLIGKANTWSQKHGYLDKFCFVYTGSLGFKHDLGVIVDLAERIAKYSNAKIIIVGGGAGFEWVKNNIVNQHKNIEVHRYQSIEQYAEVLATADVLFGFISSDASQFAVPSKILSYLCAQKPILYLIPPDNYAAKVLVRSRAGLVIPPSRVDLFLNAAERMIKGETLALDLVKSYEFAKRHFEINKVFERFQKMLTSLGEEN